MRFYVKFNSCFRALPQLLRQIYLVRHHGSIQGSFWHTQRHAKCLEKGLYTSTNDAGVRSVHALWRVRSEHFAKENEHDHSTLGTAAWFGVHSPCSTLFPRVDFHREWWLSFLFVLWGAIGVAFIGVCQRRRRRNGPKEDKQTEIGDAGAIGAFI